MVAGLILKIISIKLAILLLDLHPNSPGYRLILNNGLLQKEEKRLNF
jgi:hypothetical protein